MQAQTSIRARNTIPMMPALACLLCGVLADLLIYTGKERDTESGNDYFDARYYSSTMGRFLSPDWSAKEDTYDYDAFGNKINSTGSTPNSYLYRGEYFDSDLSLYYLRARHMNPLTGRFMSRDPKDGRSWDPISLHKYLYAEGNPINLVDPSGRESILEVGAWMN